MSEPHDAGLQRLIEGRHHDPFSVLGLHDTPDGPLLRVFLPQAERLFVRDPDDEGTALELPAKPGFAGLFEGAVPQALADSRTYRLRAHAGHGSWDFDDAYRFGPVLGELDEHLISEGAHRRLWQVLGAHPMTHEGAEGVHFAVWAPNAQRVSVVGDFNAWDGRRNPMRSRGHTGVWEIFIPGLVEGEVYKYELIGAGGQLLPQKADPFGFGAEHPPRTGSVVRRLDHHRWADQGWMDKRAVRNHIDQPISIYEVHLGSWKKVPEDGNRALSYAEHARDLVAYVQGLGFTHIELMPISEFPFDGSWGYQPVGMFAPTVRHGDLEAFRALVEACHASDMGLIIDWVPGHFPEDAHGLAQFDGTPLYEHADRREGFHPDWNTLIYNYGRREVSNYLIANALYWLQEHHVDGLRVDAVASMLYRDYSRQPGEWVPNVFGGRENLEAIDFLRRMNETVYGEVPGIMTIAEESTAFGGVSAPTDAGGLGFGYKWNMGWMNDSLSYMSKDPIYRKYHHHKMTFGLYYAFSENFILPLSHDEVVHGKGSLLDRMPGGGEEKFANLRAYFGFMWGHPGKKLLFMGGEFAQGGEWNHNQSLDWHLLAHAWHQGVQTLVRDLNQVYRDIPALHQLDSKPQGFEWVEEGAHEESIFAWLRYDVARQRPVLVVSNFTPVERRDRRIGVPCQGYWAERINTDSHHYGGGGRGNMGGVQAQAVAASGRPFSLTLTLPPLSTLIFEFQGG